MNNYFDKFADKLMPIAGKISENRILTSLRDAFMQVFPLTMFGSILVVIANLPIPFIGEEANANIHTTLWGYMGHAVDSTLTLMALFISFTFGFFLYYNSSKEENAKEALYAGIVAIASFLIVTPFVATATESQELVAGVIPIANLGAAGLFTAMLVSFSASELFRFIESKNLTIKMPEQVPPSVSRSFSALIPATLTLLAFTVVFNIFSSFEIGSLQAFIYEFLQKPLTALGTSLVATMIAALLVNLLWFMGIHGHLVVNPILETAWNAAALENLAAFQAGLELPNIVTKSFFDVFTVGTGAMGLMATIFIVSFITKNPSEREVAKLGVGAATFNVAEPILFGYPVVLNPFYFIPWVLSGPLMVLIAWLMMWSGLCPYTTGVTVPWTTPIFISGYLATNSIMGAITQLIEIVAVGLLWLPFIMAAKKEQIKQAKSQHE